VVFRSLDAMKSEAIPAMHRASQQLDFPPLLDGDADSKMVALFNLDSFPANLEVLAFDQTDSELGRGPLPPLAPMASHAFALKDLFSPQILAQLSTVRVISDRSMMGLQLVDPPDDDLVGLPALTSTSQNWSFAIVTRSTEVELWTAVGLFNPGAAATTVTVEAFDATNTSLGVIDGATILPGATHFVLTANMRGVISLSAASDEPFIYALRVNVNGYPTQSTLE